MAIKDKQRLFNQASEIYNETAKGANTAWRVGAMHVDTIDTVFSIIKPSVFISNGALCVDLGLNNHLNGDLFLQIVHYSKKTKKWQPVSGAGVQLIGGVYAGINTQQFSIPNVTLIRCKIALATNLTSFDLNDPNVVTELYDYLFTPYFKLRYYSFKQFLNDNSGPILRYYNSHRNTNKMKTSYHSYAIKKTGLAVTKAVANELGVKSFIISDILPFLISTNSTRDELEINFKNSHKITKSVSI